MPWTDRRPGHGLDVNEVRTALKAHAEELFRVAFGEPASPRSHVPAFVNTILDGAPIDFPTFADGLRTQEVLEAAEVSHNEDRWVSLPLPR